MYFWITFNNLFSFESEIFFDEKWTISFQMVGLQQRINYYFFSQVCKLEIFIILCFIKSRAYIYFYTNLVITTFDFIIYILRLV